MSLVGDSAASGSDKASILIAGRNRRCAFEFLRPFEERGISLTRIDSRPSKTEKWTYMFLFEASLTAGKRCHGGARKTQ